MPNEREERWEDRRRTDISVAALQAEMAERLPATHTWINEAARIILEGFHAWERDARGASLASGGANLYRQHMLDSLAHAI